MLKKTKLVVTALLLGLPVTSVLTQGHEEANATMRVGGSVANKVVNSVRPGLMKPPIAPKPTNIPKIPANIVSKLNKPTISTPKGNVQQKVASFNNNLSLKGKAVGPIRQRVEELNLTAQAPNPRPQINSQKGAVNSAINSLHKQDSSFQKQPSGKKLNLSSEFKNKLDSVLTGGPQQIGKKPSSTPQKQPGKLDRNSATSQKLEGIFGGGNSSSTSNKNTLSSNSQSSNQSVSNPNPNIPPAPPLPSNTPTPNQNNNPSKIPDAPPLPPSGAIPPAPPLPDSKKPIVNTQTGGSLQNQLSNKINSGLNKTPSLNKKPLNSNQNSAHNQLMQELQAKFNKK